MDSSAIDGTSCAQAKRGAVSPTAPIPGGENLSSAPRLTHDAAATGACRSRIVHGVLPCERLEGPEGAPSRTGTIKPLDRPRQGRRRAIRESPLVLSDARRLKGCSSTHRPQVRRARSRLRRTRSPAPELELRASSGLRIFLRRFGTELAAQFAIQVADEGCYPPTAAFTDAIRNDPLTSTPDRLLRKRRSFPSHPAEPDAGARSQIIDLNGSMKAS